MRFSRAEAHPIRMRLGTRGFSEGRVVTVGASFVFWKSERAMSFER
jgi:hypothetical protein